MIAVTDDRLGIGLYTVAEAAYYARVRTQLLSRWLFGDRAGERVVQPQLGDSTEKLVTFVDFIQALAIRNIRIQHGLSLRKIRDAVDRARSRYNIEFPFAREHTTFLYEGDIFICLPGEEDLVQVTGKHVHQRAIKKILELYMKDLSFDDEGLASTYVAFAHRDREVKMDPSFRFGEPFVASCGYTAQVLWEACATEGSFEAAAAAYGVSTSEVEAAFRYYDFLEGKAAA